MPNSIPNLCGSIAKTPSDLGVLMHNAAYRAAGIDYTYVAFGTESAENAIAMMRQMGLKGLGVGVPHKRTVMSLVDKIDPLAEKMGAVNSIVNREGVLTGYNVDWIGAVRAIKEKLDIAKSRAVVLGAGGAARAIIYGLLENGASVSLLNRSEEVGLQVANEFGIDYRGSLTELANMNDYELLVQATSVGFFDDSTCPISEELVPKYKFVFEAVFYPVKTKLVQIAEQNGCTIIYGYRMLVHLAACQFELYTGAKPSFEVMEQALLDSLREKETNSRD